MVFSGWTGVFWDMDDFPLPEGMDVESFVEKVDLALRRKGFEGVVEYSAYGSSDSFDYNRYMNPDYVTACKVVDKPTRLYMMLHHMLSWVLTRIYYGGLKNLLVIAKGIPGEDNMIYFLDSMIDRNIYVFTAVPDGCTPENFDYPEPIIAWEWSALCSGGRHIDLSSDDDDDDDDDDDESNSNSDGEVESNSDGRSISSETDLDCEAGSSNSQLASETDDVVSRRKEVADACMLLTLLEH